MAEIHIPYVNVFTADELDIIEGGIRVKAADGQQRKIRNSNLIFIEELPREGGSLAFRISHWKTLKHAQVKTDGDTRNSNWLSGGKKVRLSSGCVMHFNPDLVKIKDE